MRSLCITSTIFLLVSLIAYGETNPDMEKQGESVAISWLSLIDIGDYALSWQQSAEMFQAQVDEQSWIRMIGSVRSPLGAIQERSLEKTQFASTLPGVPDGQYVIAIYHAKYEKKKSAIETVTTAFGSDGKWHVAGYFIK